MEEQKIDGRHHNPGNPKGSNNGGGHKPNVEHIRNEIERALVKEKFAEKMLDLAQTCIPRLEELTASEDESVRLKAIQEVLNRAFGKSQEHHDVTTNGEPMGVVYLPSRHENALEADRETDGGTSET